MIAAKPWHSSGFGTGSRKYSWAWEISGQVGGSQFLGSGFWAFMLRVPNDSMSYEEVGGLWYFFLSNTTGPLLLNKKYHRSSKIRNTTGLLCLK